MSIVVGKAIKTGKIIKIETHDRFGHFMILGPNGCGKTSKIIKPCIWQDLVEIKNKRLKLQLLKAALNRKANIKIYKIKAMDIDKDKKIELIQKVLDKRDKKISIKSI